MDATTESQIRKLVARAEDRARREGYAQAVTDAEKAAYGGHLLEWLSATRRATDDPEVRRAHRREGPA